MPSCCISPTKGTVSPNIVLDIISPIDYQCFQRGSKADIPINGTYEGVIPSKIQARFNGSDWQIIDANPKNGVYSGTLLSQNQGQGNLEVRVLDATVIKASRHFIGIGDIFIITGQSNASGRGNNNQSYSHANLRASLFGNDYLWKELLDPSDDDEDQIDTISSDPNAAGSVWPGIATNFFTIVDLPIGFVPCAKGGLAISHYLPGADHQDRTTLYGSMVYRALQTGAKAVLWYQGETDAIQGTSEASYNSRLDTMANAINSDLGIKLMAGKIHNIVGRDETNVNNAITTAWADNPNVLQGPDFSDFTPEGNAHFTTDADLAVFISRWWMAIKNEFY